MCFFANFTASGQLGNKGNQFHRFPFNENVTDVHLFELLNPLLLCQLTLFKALRNVSTAQLPQEKGHIQ